MEVVLTADVPAALLELVAGTEDDAASVVLDRLGHGLTLRVDDREIPLLQTSARTRPDLVEGHAQVLEAHWEAEVDLRGRHTVVVGNANLGEAPCWFMNDLRLAPTMRLLDTSLVTVRRGKRTEQWGTWSRNEGQRRVVVEVETPDTTWSRWFRTHDPRPRTGREAEARPWFAAWREGQTAPETVPVAWILAAALGFGSGAARPGRLGLGAGVVALGLALHLAPPLPGALSLLVALASLLLVLDPRTGHLAPALTAWWAAAALEAPWAREASLCWVVGLSMGRWRPSTSVAAGVLALAAVAASTRG